MLAEVGTRAGIYCRISKDDGTALGVERQRADCEALAERSGCEASVLYIDNDVSAYSGKRRAEYARLCQDVKDGTVDVVIAWDPDRLHRSPAELETFIDLIDASRAKVVTVNAGNVDLSSPSGRMTARVVGAVARHESEQKSERLRRKHLELAENGKVSGGGRRPFGYEPDRLTLRRDEADRIAAAAAAILAGDSVRSVVLDWNAANVATVTGAHWAPTTVKRLLSSGRISGRREHHGQIIGPAEWAAIITPAESDRLRAILKDPARNRVAGVTARSYLLAGFVYCGRCGVKMTSRSTARSKPRYVCTKDRGGCDRCGIAAGPIEALLTEALFNVLDTSALASAVLDAVDVASNGDSARSELVEIENHLRELSADYYDARVISRSEYFAAREALTGRLHAVEASLVDSTRPQILASLDGGALAETWPSLSLDRRRAILGQVVDRVVISPTTRANNRFDPGRVSVAWKA